MGDNTLDGQVPGDFGKVASPPMAFTRQAQNLNSATTHVAHIFSMPSGKDRVIVRAAWVANAQGNAVSGLSLVLRDDVNSVVIHSETSAKMQTGDVDSPVADQYISQDTRVALVMKNESGQNLTGRTPSSGEAPSGMMVVDFK